MGWASGSETFGASIYGTRGGPVSPRAWGATTQRGDTVYVHVLDWPDRLLSLPPVGAPVARAWMLDSGEAVDFTQSGEGITLSVPGPAEEVDRVIVVERAGGVAPVPLRLPTPWHAFDTVEQGARRTSSRRYLVKSECGIKVGLVGSVALPLIMAACSSGPTSPIDDVAVTASNAAWIDSDHGRLALSTLTVRNTSDEVAFVSRCGDRVSYSVDRRVGAGWENDRADICPANLSSTPLEILPGMELSQSVWFDEVGTYRLRLFVYDSRPCAPVTDHVCPGDDDRRSATLRVDPDPG